MSYFSQDEFDIRCEWGLRGLEELREGSDVCIIVDVLSFSTSVDIAAGRGALIWPFPWKDGRAEAYASEIAAIAASPVRTHNSAYSLSPSSLLNIPAATRLVLPSPNGSALSLESRAEHTIAGCLRNATTIAGYAEEYGRRINIIAAGERWSDGSLRPSLEDLLGAGAIISALHGRKSPESLIAEAAFLQFRNRIPEMLMSCASGQELIGRGFENDVKLASELNISGCVPVMENGAYRNIAS